MKLRNEAHELPTCSVANLNNCCLCTSAVEATRPGRTLLDEEDAKPAAVRVSSGVILVWGHSYGSSSNCVAKQQTRTPLQQQQH
jgi:hypothetical protein